MKWFRKRSSFDGCKTQDEFIAEMERKLTVLRQIKFNTVNEKPPEVTARLQIYIEEGERLLEALKAEA